MNVKDKIYSIIASTSTALIQAIRGATLEELHALVDGSPSTYQPEIAAKELPAPAAPRRVKSGRLPRRSKDQILATIESITELLGKGPLRSESIRKTLGLEAREMPRLLREGVAGGHFHILSGRKRSTLYGIGGKVDKPATKPAKKAVKKPARKAPRKK